MAFVHLKAQERSLLRDSSLCESVETRRSAWRLLPFRFRTRRRWDLQKKKIKTTKQNTQHFFADTLPHPRPSPSRTGVTLWLTLRAERQRRGAGARGSRESAQGAGRRVPQLRAAPRRPPARGQTRAPTAARPGRWAGGNFWERGGVPRLYEARRWRAGSRSGRRRGTRGWRGGAPRASSAGAGPASRPLPARAPRPSHSRG